MYNKAIELEGQVSGEHGIGHAKIPYLKNSVGESCMQLMRSIKFAFDPKGILNPGKIYQLIEPTPVNAICLYNDNT
jgi:glycolate oxidase